MPPQQVAENASNCGQSSNSPQTEGFLAAFVGKHGVRPGRAGLGNRRSILLSYGVAFLFNELRYVFLTFSQFCSSAQGVSSAPVPQNVRQDGRNAIELPG